MGKSSILKIILLMALVQGIAALLRAFGWVQIGINLFGQGLLLLPFVGTVAILRGLFICALALSYFLFVAGALAGKSWARWVGVTAAIVTLLLAVAALTQGSALAEVIVWSVIPVIILVYLLSPKGRDALKGG